MKLMKKVFYMLALIYLPCLLIAPLFTDQTGSFFVFSYGVLLLLFSMYTVPSFCAYLEIGRLIGRIAKRYEMKTAEKILNSVGALLAAGIVATLVMLFAGFPSAILWHLYIAAGLVVLWIVRAIVLRQKPSLPAEFKSKSFWICTVALFLVILLWDAISYYKIKEKNQYDYYGGPSHEQEQAAVEQFMNYSL